MAGMMRLESVEFAMIYGEGVEGQYYEGLWRGDKMPCEFKGRNLKQEIVACLRVFS